MRKKKILSLIVLVAFFQLILYNVQFFKKSQKLNKLNFAEDFFPEVPLAESNFSLVIPVLVLAYNRPSVDRCIRSILKARPSPQSFPLIVSQDGDHAATEEAIRAFPQVLFMRQTNQSDYPLPKKKKKLQGYFHLSRHYKWALKQVFNEFNFTSCIIVEDDLEVSADFFEYMLATHALLTSDPSLYCVSAWNDNGKPDLVDLARPELIHRTDFFPGLGWMLTRQLWLEMQEAWPDAFWDDWMRAPLVRKGRTCLRPELSRTANFGAKGVSNGLHFKTFLGKIKNYDGFVPFTTLSLDYLRLDTFNERFLRRVYAAKATDYKQLYTALLNNSAKVPDDDLRVTYNDFGEFVAIAKLFGVMADHKSGIPRTAYRGVVPIKFKGKSIFIAPIYDWRGYNEKEK